MEGRLRHLFPLLATLLTLCACAPISEVNPHTGHPAAAVAGGAIGYGIGDFLRFPRGVNLALGVGGAGLGYYLSTQRFAAAALIHAGGQVFSLGQYVTINLPTDTLFEPNSADFEPDAEAILTSAMSVLSRYPNNNIIISGNTSGFGSDRHQHKLSEARARAVAAFFWVHGINNFNDRQITTDRKLLYVGYGNFFPVAKPYRLEGLRANSRIQITAAPSDAGLDISSCHVFNNIGADIIGIDPKIHADDLQMPAVTATIATEKPYAEVPYERFENIAATPSEPFDPSVDQTHGEFRRW